MEPRKGAKKPSAKKAVPPRAPSFGTDSEPSVTPRLPATTENARATTALSPAASEAAKPTPSAQKQAEDRALVRRAKKGDERAFGELARRHRHGVERMVRPLVRSAPSDEVEDLVQEAITKAFLHIHSYSEEFAFTTWLYRIATNHAIDYLRRRKLNAFSISAPPTAQSHKGEDDSREYEISDESWVPEDLMLSKERSRLIEEAIEKLPGNYKKVIRLRHSEDMEYEEIARVLDIPMGTVKVHLHRARAALGKMLEGKI